MGRNNKDFHTSRVSASEAFGMRLDAQNKLGPITVNKSGESTLPQGWEAAHKPLNQFMKDRGYKVDGK